MLNETQLKALAREARKLASEYAEGLGPTLQVYSWCGCAAGELIKRAGIASELDEVHIASYLLDRELSPAFTLTHATEAQFLGRTPGALVFPLLWAADELENAAQRPPVDEETYGND